ncbi:MAG: hypothetical protein HYY18_02105 [Planctomycetes bacterium]|nr:hypothetical protein [Planctomycetota bacterium]
MCCDNEGRHSCCSSGFLAWAGSWLLFPISPILSVLLGGLSFAQSFGSGARLTRSTLLTPFVLVPVFFIFQGAADYSSGHAVLHRNAVAVTRCESRYLESDWDVDPRTRLPYMETPCGFGSLFTHRAYNRTVIFLSRKFGPQRGAYTGRIPELRQVRAALARGEVARSQEVMAFPDLYHYATVAHAYMEQTFVLEIHEDPDKPSEFSADSVALDPPIPESPCRVVRATLGSDIVAYSLDDFVLIADARTGREIARHGELSRIASTR